MRAPLVDTYDLGLAYAHIGSGRFGNRPSPEGVDNTLPSPMQARELIKGSSTGFARSPMRWIR